MKLPNISIRTGAILAIAAIWISLNHPFEVATAVTIACCNYTSVIIL